MYKFGIFLLLASLLSACNRTVEPVGAHDHDQDSGDVTAIQSTLFTDHYEYFIEYDPLVAGSASGFLVHVTRLDTYDPVTAGSLTIQIGEIRVTADAPVRPGIFELEVVPGTAGEHEIIYLLQTAQGADQVRARANAAGATDEGDITFLKEQAWKSDFMVRKTIPVPFSAVVKASGQVLTLPGEKKHLAAHNSGMLVFHDKLLVPGSRVEKGAPLFVILATSLSDDNFEVRYRELRNNLEQSRSEFRRHEKLFREQVISERQFIASKINYENDSIRFRSLASKASADGLQIIAPISGTIHELNFSEGQYVETGDQLVTISSNEKFLLRVDVPMQDYPMVEHIVTANFRTGYSDRIYTVEELKGTLLTRGSSVAENDHFIPLYFEVTNDGTLLEGAFAEFFLKTREQQQAIVVPAGAIAEEQGIHYCYLQVTGESFIKQEVTIGESDGRFYEVITGLEKGDRVVTEGIMLLKAASMVTGEAGHGHAH